MAVFSPALEPQDRICSRPMERKDVPACACILREEFSQHQFEPDLVLKVWPEMLSRGSLHGAVVEDRQQILSFGASVVVTDQFASHLLKAATPYIGAQITRNALMSDSVTLVSAASTATSSSGLTICIIHSGLPTHDQEVETAARIKSELMQAFVAMHRGYRVNSIFVEAFGARERSFYEADGAFMCVNDFGLHFEASQISPPPVSERPCLFVLTRDRVLSMEMHPLLSLFLHARPQCSFSPGEQILLAHALQGHTDGELALAIGVSLETVKKRWVQIFNRVEDALPQVLLTAANRREHQKRGAQKRHLLLRYLRNHPEELRS